MSDSINDVYSNLIKRDRFKARYSTRGSGVLHCNVGGFSFDIEFDLHANLSFTTGPREIVDGVPTWKFEAAYDFSIRNYSFTLNSEGGMSLLEESSGSGNARTQGFLKASKWDTHVELVVSLDPVPLQPLIYTYHYKDAGDSGPEETTETRTHKIFFGILPSDIGILDKRLHINGFNFRKPQFTVFKSWQKKLKVGDPITDLYCPFEVVLFQEIAFTDGNTLPSFDDCIPLIEVLEENGKTPVPGKSFDVMSSDGSKSTHVTDDKGQIRLYVTDDEKYIVEKMQEYPEKGEARHSKTESP